MEERGVHQEDKSLEESVPQSERSQGEHRIQTSIPGTESELEPKLFGIFNLKENLLKLKPSGGVTHSCATIFTSPNMITNITAQDCTEGTGYGEHQPIGRPVRVGHWEQTVWV